MAVLTFGGVEIAGVGFIVTTMVYASALCVTGYQSLLFFWLTKLFATQEGFLPASDRYRSIVDRWSTERGSCSASPCSSPHVVVGIVQVVSWGGTDFGAQNAAEVIRVAIPSSLGIMLGFQTLLMSSSSGVLATPRRTAPGHATIED
ncbi:MAG: hypothetical protein R2692_00965 [Microbacterium sp.]